MEMGGISIWQLIILAGMLFLFVVPPLAALLSKKAQGWDKLFWFIAASMFSWLGYLGYYFAIVRGKHKASQAQLPS